MTDLRSTPTATTSAPGAGSVRGPQVAHRAALLVFLLMGAVQIYLAALGENNAFVGGLHAIDGLVILGLAGFLQGAAARRVSRQ